MDLAPHIAKAEGRLHEVEGTMAAYDFKAPGNDQRGFEALSREHQRLTRIRDTWRLFQQTEKEIADHRELLNSETDAELVAMAKGELPGLEAGSEQLERRLKTLILPPRPNEKNDIIVEIRPAAGGDEAGLFAADLFRLYTRFAESKHWKVEVLELSETPLGGIKEAIFSLRGEEAYRYFAFESGVHRVQRVPVTEAAGRIHTSTVTVAVMPEVEEVELQINPSELRMDVFRASGHGGQNVNRTDSAVRLTHLPTGLAVASQQEKSQHRNREIALRLLRSRLLERMQSAEDAKHAAERKSQVGTGARNERIRSYNFPQNRVSDHRFEITRYDLSNIMEGEKFADLLETILAIDVERRFAAELK